MRNRWIALLKRYAFFLALLAVNLVMLAVVPAKGAESFRITGSNLLDMLSVLPPIFILLGLLDVWVKRETMMRLMGEKAGLVGILVAFALGSLAAGPLYAAFPVATVLLRKGGSLFNVLVFIGAWSTTKIPLLLFEATSMGPAFMLTRFLIDIPGILLIAWVSHRLLRGRVNPDGEKPEPAVGASPVAGADPAED